jgi:uncharacterized protein (DUF952 family)
VAWPVSSYRRFYRSHPEQWSTAPSGGWIPCSNPIDVSAYFINSSTDNNWHTSDAKKRRGKTDVGSNWTAVKTQAEIAPFYVHFISSHAGGDRGYKGFTFVADWYNVDFGITEANFNASTESALYGYGATAINRCLPTSPIVDLPVAVGELFTEGLPAALGAQFLRNRRLSADDLSGEYLNYSFGIKPFLNDMVRFSEAFSRAEALIDEYAARAGKVLRRGYRFPTELSETNVNVSNNSGYKFHFAGLGQSTAQGFMTPVLGGWPGDRVDPTKTRKSRWFKGAFTYHLPGAGKDFSSRLSRETAEMRHLYGGLSIDTAWNLLPFSWAADWVTNAGDVISNIEAFARDGLVMPWGYIMEHVEVHVDRKVTGARIGQQKAGWNYRFPKEVHTSYSSHYMRRRKATPYGFGLDPTQFNARQWSILTALGIQQNLR